MIAYLQGQIAARDEQSVVLVVGGVGYQVYLSERDLRAIPPERREQTFFIYQHVREDANVLYGFPSWQERKIFLALLSVSGIGPKMALTILAAHPAAEIVNIIYRGDTAGLSIGKKTAEKVVVELKDKIGKLFPELIMDKNAKAESWAVSQLEQGFLSEIRAALNALGYTLKETDDIIRRNQAALAALKSVEEAVTYLLKHL
ncbi:Holliday junction helicase RuvA [Candidatus Termititenax persephonae]|uniref:Holliday junction branch migration complex subunit RuvA n=1 Tax=Candidatus Termititenax persephonae TaxID=2218525 RepID=A0A388THP9_9BACT|nr:Holliday junction helicase RuvA [Candidatus Termititenax persephonae]